MDAPLLPPLEVLNGLLKNEFLLVDARSEGEFAKGNIPGSINIPLLNNEDRHLIGIEYKAKGQQAAVDMGFERVGPRFSSLLRRAREAHAASGKPLVVLCWRGGLRSQVLAWVLHTAGLPVSRSRGGYKHLRSMLLQTFHKTFAYRVVAGKTGAGKTETLHALHRMGQQVCDLEGLASHRGSAFGSLGLQPQPTQEQFENNLGLMLFGFRAENPVWLEHESRMIGRICLPQPFFEIMQKAPHVALEVAFAERSLRILKDYGNFPVSRLEESTRALQRRLGGLAVSESVQALNEGRLHDWLKPLLAYYDKAYDQHWQLTPANLKHTLSKGITPEERALELMKWLEANG
jgi:tRNA 2-selenouridine synthase